jgi:hypothetical protein
MWFTPEREVLQALIDKTQEFVTGVCHWQLTWAACSGQQQLEYDPPAQTARAGLGANPDESIQPSYRARCRNPGGVYFSEIR